MDFKNLGSRVGNSYIFKGSRQRPFLAPRGVFTADNKLFVSDTGHNRVFIWNTVPTCEYKEPDVILGQLKIDDTGRNAGSDISAATLYYPSGIWSDGCLLVLADAWNHRVLIWNTLPTHNGQPADVVLGQSDFTTNAINGRGVGNDPTSQTFYWPYGVFSDGSRLWVADTGNRRILFFKTMPKKNFAGADAVIGQPNFTTRDYTSGSPVWPYAVKINEKGILAVADTQCYRTLVWTDAMRAFGQPADVIIGQPNFEACGQNQFFLSPFAKSLSWIYDVCFYKDGILVSDTGNSRVLWFNSIPMAHNAAASAVIGKRDFKTGSENADTRYGTGDSLYWPFSITTDKNKLLIADTGNHRLFITDLKF